MSIIKSKEIFKLLKLLTHPCSFALESKVLCLVETRVYVKLVTASLSKNVVVSVFWSLSMSDE